VIDWRLTLTTLEKDLSPSLRLPSTNDSVLPTPINPLLGSLPGDLSIWRCIPAEFSGQRAQKLIDCVCWFVRLYFSAKSRHYWSAAASCHFSSTRSLMYGANAFGRKLLRERAAIFRVA